MLGSGLEQKATNIPHTSLLVKTAFIRDQRICHICWNINWTGRRLTKQDQTRESIYGYRLWYPWIL